MSLEQELEMAAKTAIRRKGPSYPLKLALEKGLISGKILDYGCGVGADVEHLKSLGYDAVGYDPCYFPRMDVLKDETYDTVLCFYVLNVVFPDTREKILQDIYRVLKPNGKAIIAVRDVSEKIAGEPFLDGVITAKGTFQKTFTVDELVSLVSKYFDEVEVISRSKPLMVVAWKRSSKGGSMEEYVKSRLMKKFEEKLEDKDLLEMSYDELYNEIMLNSDDIDTLTTIAEAVRSHPKLTDFEKEKLWEIIDKEIKKRG